MNEDKPKLSVELKPGGQVSRHGGYSFLTKGVLPERRSYLRSYLTAARAQLIGDLGPTENDLTAAQIILIDRIISMLGVLRCIEEHIRETSVMVGQKLAPSLQASYITYNNAVRMTLKELGIHKRVGEGILDVQEAIAKFDREKGGAASEKEKA